MKCTAVSLKGSPVLESNVAVITLRDRNVKVQYASSRSTNLIGLFLFRGRTVCLRDFFMQNLQGPWGRVASGVVVAFRNYSTWG